MTAYFRSSLSNFLIIPDEIVLAKLTSAYSRDGFKTQYTSATIAWVVTLPNLRAELEQLVKTAPYAASWQVLLEYPLYRLRRRIDAVILTPSRVLVIELKTGAHSFEVADKRQAIEYAQDLRDFHSESKQAHLIPVLWSMRADGSIPEAAADASVPGVGKLCLVGSEGIATLLLQVGGLAGFASNAASDAFGKMWDEAAYRPVPSVIDAAVTLFAGHGVREIAIATARNLDEAASSVFKIIESSRQIGQHAVVFLTGVPGAGKTLAGLNIVHHAVEKALTGKGDVVYLSGNTPLVVVLREALARDQHIRKSAAGEVSSLKSARAFTRATIQHIIDFLKQYVNGPNTVPSDHVIVFDEAQRAWDARQGKEKFNRDASEPYLVLEAMARHTDWSVTVCLIGTGQEINDGEEGLAGWAEAIERLSAEDRCKWKVYGPERVFGERRSVHSLGPLAVSFERRESLHLDVPMRSFRSPELGEWINALLTGDISRCREISRNMSYPLAVTRSLNEAREWLKRTTGGERRMGLLASSGARRLRADGIGEVLSATDGAAIAHWYLNSPGDIRSSFALEVPANEYTSQGLEVDFACLCWGGDLVHSGQAWRTRVLSGNRWNEVADPQRSSFIVNSYRVLLSRAREGLVIWVPRGDAADHTRSPQEFDQVAACLLGAGAVLI